MISYWFYIPLLLFSIQESASINDSHSHALYLSVVELEVNELSKVSLKIKIFADDLVDALRHDNSLNQSMFEKLIIEELNIYFNKYLKVKSDDSFSEIKVVDYQKEGESFFINAVLAEENFREVTFQIGYLFELFPTQQNILKVKKDGAQSYYLFKSADQIEVFGR